MNRAATNGAVGVERTYEPPEGVEGRIVRLSEVDQPLHVAMAPGGVSRLNLSDPAARIERVDGVSPGANSVTPMNDAAQGCAHHWPEALEHLILGWTEQGGVPELTGLEDAGGTAA